MKLREIEVTAAELIGAFAKGGDLTLRVDEIYVMPGGKSVVVTFKEAGVTYDAAKHDKPPTMIG